ncbi:uncharacterized protein ACB058_007578 [Synchiropus picturatus]
METERAEPAGDLDAPLHPAHQMCSESDTDDSEDWRETNNTRSNSNSVENPNIDVKEEPDDDDHKSLIDLTCGKKCILKDKLTDCKKSCGGPLTCLLCGNHFETRKKLLNHMRIHTGVATVTLWEETHRKPRKGGDSTFLLQGESSNN